MEALDFRGLFLFTVKLLVILRDNLRNRRAKLVVFEANLVKIVVNLVISSKLNMHFANRNLELTSCIQDFDEGILHFDQVILRLVLIIRVLTISTQLDT